jgi:hypothetical protein
MAPIPFREGTSLMMRTRGSDKGACLDEKIPTSMEIGVCKLEYHDFSMD